MWQTFSENKKEGSRSKTGPGESYNQFTTLGFDLQGTRQLWGTWPVHRTESAGHPVTASSRPNDGFVT